MDALKKIIDDLENVPNCYEFVNYATYIKNGITIKTDFGKNFPSMTLSQYAIAKRNPNALKIILDISLNYCNISIENIITPHSSTTKLNLIDLAIVFGSVCVDYNYNEEDIKCLQVVVEFAEKNKFSIELENRNQETPLFRAIRCQNYKAIEFLLDKGADLYRKTNSPCKTPFQYLVLSASDVGLLKKVSDTISDRRKFVEMLKGFNDERIPSCVKQFIEDQTQNNIVTIQQLNEQSNQDTNSTDQPDQPAQLTENSLGCCSECKNEATDTCDKCNKRFCLECYSKHKCVQ